MPDVPPWAGVVGDVTVHLRRGAWYEVVRLTPDAVLWDVQHRSLSIPRSTLEIVTPRPRRWSVVTRPYDAVDLPISWGARYAVCPECKGRAPISGHPMEMQCPRCHGIFPLRLP